MPIYAYRCAACGHSRDVLQKLSDAPLTVCPACGAESFAKQVTAAGFQLKGSGWYVTDFRNNGGGAASSASGGTATTGESAASASAAADSGSASTAAAGSTPCGGSCACH